MTSFLTKVVNQLFQIPALTLTTLIRNKYSIARSIQELVSAYRQQAMNKGYQKTLFAGDADILTTYDFSYEFKADNYPIRSPYHSGKYDFEKHYYPQIENMKPSGEEFDCAQIIESLT